MLVEITMSCDSSVSILKEVTEEQYQFLEDISHELNKVSEDTSWGPRMYVESEYE